MALLSIRLFGRPRAVHDGAAEISIAHTSQTLLAFLLLHRDFSPRDVLASLCWAEQPDDQARSCLNTALWRLRTLLEPPAVPKGTYLVTTGAGEVGFNWQSQHWLDLTEFETAAKAALGHPPHTLTAAQVGILENALRLYTGDLLEGFYDDWALRERERLRSLYLDVLLHLMRFHAVKGTLGQGIAAGQRILSLDPLREDVHRELIRLYSAAGQRALAVKQYLTCREILATELGIPPMDETEACYRQLLPLASPARGVSEPGLAAALLELAAARRQLSLSQEQLRRAAALVERLALSGASSPPLSCESYVI